MKAREVEMITWSTKEKVRLTLNLIDIYIVYLLSGMLYFTIYDYMPT